MRCACVPTAPPSAAGRSHHALTADATDDYWTCNQQFVVGIPVPDSYADSPAGRIWGDFFGHRVCRAINPIARKVCRRCGMGAR